MAITRSQSRKLKARSLKIQSIGNNTTFKSMAVGNIMGNFYKEQHDNLDGFYQRELQERELSITLLREKIMEMEFQDAQTQRHIVNLNRIITYGNSRINELNVDRRFMDTFVQDLYTQHPEICWEYRNRLQYDTHMPVDPEATEVESDVPEEYRHLFSDSEDEAMSEHMREEGYY